MKSPMIKIVRPWPAEQPRPPIVTRSAVTKSPRPASDRRGPLSRKLSA
jgi:hypothetical protein